jgi:hypothetical protein
MTFLNIIANIYNNIITLIKLSYHAIHVKIYYYFKDYDPVQ